MAKVSKAKEKPKTGPATELLNLVFAESEGATSHSWGRINHAMHKALALAIGAGFKFVKADFEGLSEFRSRYWIGDSDEWCYSMAIAEGNYSAAEAFEQWKGRAAIIADNVTPAGQHESFAHRSGPRDKERLHVGCYFEWQGDRVKVTSFSGKGEAVAVAYKPAEGQYDHERKVKRRYTITRELVIQDRAERKQREAITQDLLALYEKNRTIDFKAEFGVATMKELNTIPFKRFAKIADGIKAKAA